MEQEQLRDGVYLLLGLVVFGYVFIVRALVLTWLAMGNPTAERWPPETTTDVQPPPFETVARCMQMPSIAVVLAGVRVSNNDDV